jgi:hypothetical protein
LKDSLLLQFRVEWPIPNADFGTPFTPLAHIPNQHLESPRAQAIRFAGGETRVLLAPFRWPIPVRLHHNPHTTVRKSYISKLKAAYLLQKAPGCFGEWLS